jgi:hypothetical protein
MMKPKSFWEYEGRKTMSWYNDVSLDNAQKCANNWKHFESFGIRNSHRYEGMLIFYTSNRDSGLLEQSNAKAIEKALSQFSNEDHSHWAVGWVRGYAVRVFDANGELTPAFKELCALAAKLESYPVLDEDDYSSMQYEASLSNIEDTGRRYVKEGTPDSWPQAVFSWLWDNSQETLEDSDDQGSFPSEDAIKEALKHLGMLEEEDNE